MPRFRLFAAFLICALLAGCAAGAQDAPGASAPPADPALAGWNAYQTLAAEVAKTNNVDNQQALVDTFLRDYPVSPLVKDTQAIFLVNKPGADRVLLTGDMTNWFDVLQMKRVGQTSLWSLAQELPANARVDYRYGLSGGGMDGLFLDPRNPNQVISGFGPHSELRMPAYQAPVELIARTGIPTGTLEDLGRYQSAVTTTTHRLRVYLPPGYDPAQRYPTAYFQDGDDYLDFAHAATIFDNAIADGALPPLIGVFVYPSREQGRQRDYDLNDRYAEFFATELVPMIDAKYSTIPEPASRVVVGDSYGGLISLYIGLLYPDIFGGVVNQSGYVSRHRDRLASLFAINPGLPLRIFTVVGTFETCIGGPVLGPECNFLEGNRNLRDVLQAGGYALSYSEHPQGHSWGFWPAFVDDGIAWGLNYQRKN